MRSPPLVSGLPCGPTRCSRESRSESEHNRVDWSPSSKNFTEMKFLSPGSGELRQMVRCLELYYRQQRSQKDIAKALGVSAATVSRLLKRAFDDGLVRVELDLPRMPRLEAALVEAYRLRRRLLRDPEIRRVYEAARDVDIALVGVGMIAEQTPGFCSLAESYGVSVRRLRQLGVVGEINYQPFNTEGRVVDAPELRALMRRILSVGVDRMQALSRRGDRRVFAIAGGRPKLEAIQIGRAHV